MTLSRYDNNKPINFPVFLSFLVIFQSFHFFYHNSSVVVVDFSVLVCQSFYASHLDVIFAINNIELQFFAVVSSPN